MRVNERTGQSDLRLLERARDAGIDIRCDGDEVVLRGPKVAEELILYLAERKSTLLTELALEQKGPWPAETWGPLLPEHFAIRTLDDLNRLPNARP